jgi:lambda family phage minor tail protein L
MSLTTEGVIAVYKLDTTMLGGPVFYLASAGDFAQGIVWGGIPYQELPMEMAGFDYTTRGTLPQPTVTFSNIFGAGNTLLDTYKGLIGALVTRTVTLTRFLDSGTTPDPNAFISMDVYVVSQKLSHTAVSIAFKLTSRLDQEGSKIPRRLILRDICTHSYRVWDGAAGDFSYANATCPYAGANAFNARDQAVTPSQDNCSRSISGCTARYGTLPLPARFFPGVGRTR